MFDTGTFDYYTFDLSASGSAALVRDTHDGMLRRIRHSPVYPKEYYDKLREKPENPPEIISSALKKVVEKIEEAERVPNLLIPLDELIGPVGLPSLMISPAPLPVPAPLRASPQLMPTAESFAVIANDIDKENETAHAMLASEIERDRREFEIEKLAYDRLLSTVKGRLPVKNVMVQLTDAIDKLHKATQAKKRMIYDKNGRLIGVEPILEEENPV